MTATVETGLCAESVLVVGEGDTAIALGSGDVPVLGTPRLLALVEAATVAALGDRLGPGQTSVGTSVALVHQAASPIGAEVVAAAELTEADGRRLVFTVEAQHRADGTVVATGWVERVVVDREKFLARLV
ncbi:thioesterase [Actinomadura craniellae]|uniref:Thioesterase n=1 Tax=Actinomadura craniellae TaxID=2231787 RepID=A0A365H2U9_9ACTN|nr:thioesterase [Actinomadura craniellae]RAY13421.1 thioesterase [Actinomadura craniellae]